MTISRSLALFAICFVMHCANPTVFGQTIASKEIVKGQLKLPHGEGSGGLQLIIGIRTKTNALHHEWLDIDQKFNFRSSFAGSLEEVEVVSGIDKTVTKFGRKRISKLKRGTTVDLGVMDLRKDLRRHQLKLINRTNTNSPLRVGMWLEKPRLDVSLGSKQFPEVKSGSTVNWLVPAKFKHVYFMVELPADANRGVKWRSGKKKLFGPYRFSELPSELIMKQE